MPETRGLAAVAWRRMGWFVRDRFPRRRVVRDVQGVRLVLPWSHRLPDYTAGGSVYGQNLVQLAVELAAGSPEDGLTMLDVGANVGDSALQVLHAVPAKVLCVEGDPYYFDFLELNAGADPHITRVETLLTSDAAAVPLAAVRGRGTTRFAESGAPVSVPTTTPESLRAAHPDFGRLRLVKSDTDGFDVVLVPAIARAWADSAPVLFFEYDHRLSRLAGNDPVAVWPQLAQLGYDTAAVWDNAGRAVALERVDAMAQLAAVLDHPARGVAPYWDVAVAHGSDAAGRAALSRMCSFAGVAAEGASGQ
ncbi:FkbM family methyltransferase [Nocardioides sp. SYSU DS0651]|uniref:FkbM family methyltransferase n=1 Tax=Nocardioides sp. SYSU DS0651 TaxID=3415955 RepID=UPI003F4B0C7B